MKRYLALLVIVCLALSALWAAAEDENLGNMEVVNCNEWVSLRKTPSTSARRLVKVSLGAVVSNCHRVDDTWIYAEYDGYSGYILAKYLQPSDGRLNFNAMLITITDEGAPLYSTIDGARPVDFIPTDTIVRNCLMMDNGRVYVEWGSRCGFVRAEHAEVYNEMLHFPYRVILHTNLYAGKYEGAAPDIRIDYKADFPLAAYDYSEYDCREYLSGDEQGALEDPLVEFVLHSDETLHHVHLFDASLIAWDTESGDAAFEAVLEHIQYQVDPEHPLSVTAQIYGMTPNLVVGYEDARGMYHFVFVEISGEDGRLLLREF